MDWRQWITAAAASLSAFVSHIDWQAVGAVFAFLSAVGALIAAWATKQDGIGDEAGGAKPGPAAVPAVLRLAGDVPGVAHPPMVAHQAWGAVRRRLGTGVGARRCGCEVASIARDGW